MAHPVTWFQIQGPDGPALERFYAAAFGWRMTPSPDGRMAFVSKEKGGIDGGIGTSQSGDRSVSVYVSVDDVDAHLAKVEAAGAKVVMPKLELPDDMGHIAGFLDPAGNWIGLWAPRPKAAKARPPKADRADGKSKTEKADKKADKKAGKKADKKTAKKAEKKAGKKADKKRK